MATAALVFAVLAAPSTALMLLGQWGGSNVDGLSGFFEMIAAVLFGLGAAVLLAFAYFAAQRRGVPLPTRASVAGILLLVSLAVGLAFNR